MYLRHMSEFYSADHLVQPISNVYDDLGRVTQSEDPTHLVTETAYHADGNITQQIQYNVSDTRKFKGNSKGSGVFDWTDAWSAAWAQG